MGAECAAVVVDTDQERAHASFSTPVARKGNDGRARRGADSGGQGRLDDGPGRLRRRDDRRVGADRVANAVAAQDRYQPPLMVIDFGTATTFDVVDRVGNYCGGVIAPGINLSLRALDMAAAQLPRIGIRRPPTVVGRATVPAMQSGVFWGYVGLIEGLVRRIKTEREEAMQVVATGGLAPLIAEATEVINRVDPDLTLWGLRLIYRRNSNR